MNVLFVTPEVAPYSGSGDLAEISGVLPRALREAGARVTVLTPYYRGIDPDKHGLARRIRKMTVPVGDAQLEVGLYDGQFANCDVPLIFIDHAESFQREGIYGESQGPYPDNHRRFYLLARAALVAIRELGLQTDIIHAWDWPTAFIPLLLKLGALPECHPKVLFTLCDAAAAPTLEASVLDELQLGRSVFHPEGVEFHGRFSLLKAGILYSDLVSTMSRAHVRELQTKEQGGGLHGLYQAQRDKLVGVIPGLKRSAWDPSADHRLAERYSIDAPAGKEACKRALQTELGLPVRPQIPLVTMLGPLTEPRGIELLLRALPELLKLKIQLAVLGQTTTLAAARLERSAAESAQTLVYRPNLDGDALHRVLAGADAVMTPSRYEPGGLQQLKALAYGAVPLVRYVGGLMDTVVDFDPKTLTGTGICFNEFEETSLVQAVQRLVALHGQPPLWQALVQNAMRQTYSWERSARNYLEIYQQLLKPRT